MVWQGPGLGFVPETGRFVAMETPWVRFSCLLAFVPCFLLFVFRFSFLIFFLHTGMFIFFVSLRLCSSHLLLSASTYFIPSRNSLVFFIRPAFFFVGLISRVAFLLLCYRTRYASTWFAYLDSLAFGFSLPHCDHWICISLGWIRKDTECTADIDG